MVSQLQGFRLSPQQRQLWQQHGMPRACCVVSIAGQLASTALHNALQLVVQRHEILRTTYQRVAGIKTPIQCIAEAATFTWHNIDLHEYSQPQQTEEIEKQLHAERTSVTTYEQEPALRIFLFTLSTDSYTLLLSLPALSADNATFTNLVQEMSAAYAQTELTDEEELIQYLQFSEWQHELLTSEEADEGKNYWLKQPLNAAVALPLPGETISPDQATPEIAFPPIFTLKLPSELVAQIEAISAHWEIEPNIFLLTCWQTLLWRLTGANTIAVNTVFNGRKHEEISTILGLCTQSLPIHGHFAATIRFAEMVKQLAQTVNAAETWQEYFTEELCPECVEYATTLRISFEATEQPDSYDAAAVTFCIQQQYASFESYKIKLTCIRHEHALVVEFRYLPAYFDSQAVQRLAGQFQTLIESVIANPNISIQQATILSADERQRLLIDLNQTSTAYPTEGGFQRAFEEQVAISPDALALVFQEQCLTYAALNARANQLAHYLQTSGVGPDILVAVCLERSPLLIIALLGILKAGGAYIPIDPDYPQSRIAFMLADMQERVLLTSERLSAQFPAIPVRRICLDKDWQTITHESQLNPLNSVSPEQLAYVIYTSGSTGTPKGVMISQGGLCNYLFWSLHFYQVRTGSGSLVHSSIGFDLTVTSLFVPLLAGRTVFLAPEAAGIEGLLEVLLQRPGLSLLKITPAHLDLLTHLLPAAELPHVARVLVIGGEALPAESLIRWRELAPATRLVNEYGPTETVVGCCIYEVQPTDPHIGMVPVGKPIANTQLYILDEDLQPVPWGVEGELYIGGKGVARGYRGQAALTAERFVPAVWNSTHGERLYKSGDRARYGANDTIEFLGRRDEQIKIRGYRIELGEIETVLGQHPVVRSNAVVVQEDEAGNKRLLAYVVGTEAAIAPVPEDLRRYLQEKLPDYMLPAAFVLLETLPLTANGKVDRKTLATIQGPQSSERTIKLTARSPIEELISSIWCDVLKIPQADIHDNFFASGGHSLLATQLISRLKSMLRVEVSLSSLFKQPTIAALAVLAENALRSGKSSEVPPFLSVPREEDLPLSFAQQRLWFLEQLEPGNTAYLIPVALRLHGALHIQAFARSLYALIQRHETLRTTFAVRRGQPVQLIHPTGSLHFPAIDLRGLPVAVRLSEAQRLAQLEARTPCDLVTGPLLRTWLVRLDEQEHALFITLHHIISDGWSSDLLQRELSVLYLAFTQGRSAPLPPLLLQYADYTLWQRSWLHGEMLQAQLAYWKQQLGGLTPLTLPTDRPRPPVQTFQGAYQTVLLPIPLQEKLSALSQQHNVTLFMLLLAAFMLQLQRYSNQSDISVGTPIANRTHEQTEGIVGFFVNTLVLRTNLADNPTFIELLQRVCEVCLGAYTHQDVPFEQLVEALRPERDLSHSPLFQVMFILQQDLAMQAEERKGQFEFEQLSSSALDIEHTTTKFDITLNVTSNARGLRCGIEYNTDLFDAETIQRFLEHWQILIEGIVAAPHSRLSELPILSQSERKALLFDYNATQNASYSETSLPGLFAAQVASAPDTIAIVSEELTLSYSALSRHADQLAYYLHSVGVAPEVRVGVSVERSATLLICFLALLKVGGTYVPLDPAYPPARQQYMLTDARLTFLLSTHTELAFAVPASTTVINLPQIWPLLALQQPEAPTTHAHMDTAAYVIYTSGSTGTPKGVVVTHRGLGNLACAQAQAFGVQATSHVLQFASPNFDASISEIIVTLAAGASLYLAPQKRLLPGAELLTLLREWAITVVTLPPSALAVLPMEPLPALATLIVAGEECPASLPRRWAVDRRFCNAYGPTEATVCASVALCAAYPPDQQKPGIGTPLANTELYILDDYLHPVPQGVAGELYIGGISLARGYLHQAGMTAERFLPHPFSAQKGARLYKTGDQVRLRRDGTVEFLGRLDQQVKVRGYRIELGEIESALAEHPAIQDAAVILHAETPDTARLVAYITCRQNAVLANNQWRAYLQKRLPDYMIPARFIVLDALPSTPAGKIDRQALLLAGDEHNSVPERVTGRAQTPLEELLSEIWHEVLESGQIDRQSNFFHVGGHSLLATQLVARIRAVLHVDVALQMIFEVPTLAAMAANIEQYQYHKQGIVIPPLVPVSREDELPLSFAQQRLWLLNQLEPDNVAYTIPLSVSILGNLQLNALEHSLDEIVRRHESLRTTFHVSDGQPIQIIEPPQGIGLRHIDLQTLAPAEQAIAMDQLAHQYVLLPFQLHQGPLIRVTLLHLGTRRYHLLASMHHIVSDGWSNSILEYELNTLYTAYVAGEPSPLPELVIQYADYAAWQRSWLQGEVLQKQLAYWQKQLAGARALKLPTDTPRSQAHSQPAALYRFALPSTLTQDLSILSRQEGVTLFMTLLAAFQSMLYRWSGQTDLVVGTDVANRTHIETEKMIGFFINLLVLRTQLQGNIPFRKLLSTVRETVQAAYMHQQAPFELLAEQLQWERSRNQTPLVQVLFVLQNIPAELAAAPADITFRPVESEATEAKFDLALFLSEEANGLQAAVKYNSALFTARTIETMLQRFVVLLQHIVADRDTPLDLLRFSTDTEQKQLTEQGKDHRLKLQLTKGKGIDLA